MLSRFLSLFSFEEKPAAAPAGMRVVPCSALDVGARAVVMTVGLAIDARLDPQTLEQSLSTLIERKFPRAGARLAFRNDAYEFHIPCTFDSHNPPIAFTAQQYREPYQSPNRPDIRALVNFSDSEPVACRFPSLEKYLMSKTCPTSTYGFLASNTPMVHVHVSVFDDLTFIGVTSSQMMFDVVGTRTLFHAWTRLLAGEDIDAIQGMEWDVTPFEGFQGTSSIGCVRGYSYQCSPGLLELPLDDYQWLRSLLRDGEECKLIRVPKAFLEDRRLKIMGDLKRQGSTECIQISDVLLAWWFKTSYGLRRSNDTTEVYIHLPVDLRPMRIFPGGSDTTEVYTHLPVDLRPKLIFPGGSALTAPYINNASSTVALEEIAAGAFQRESLGELALRIRRTITAYDAGLLTIQHELVWRNADRLTPIFRGIPIRGDEGELQTNWCDARLSELDFSGARTLGSEYKGRGRVLLVLANTMLAADYMSLRGHGAILMEDANAIWMSQVKSRKEWKNLGLSGHLKFI